jgi:hypothetical protein
MTGPPELARLLAAEWHDVTRSEQEQAVERAAAEGRAAARWYLAKRVDGRPGPAPLRASRWARKIGMHTVSTTEARMFAAAYSLPFEHDYVDHVINRCAPDRMSWWGGADPDELRRDPRVCAFCAAYERERRLILRLESLPTGIADLQLHLWEMKEEELKSARAWYWSEQSSYGTPEEAARERSRAQGAYRWRQFRADLAEMLLEAAIFSVLGNHEGAKGTNEKGDSHGQHLRSLDPARPAVGPAVRAVRRPDRPAPAGARRQPASRRRLRLRLRRYGAHRPGKLRPARRRLRGRARSAALPVNFL